MHLLRLALSLLLIDLAGCAGDERLVPERLAAGVHASSLPGPLTICHGTGYQDLTSVTVPLSEVQGDTLYLFAKATALRVESGDHTTNVLEAVRIQCPGRSVQSTRNHRGTDSPDQTGSGMVQYASLLYHPAPGATEVTCQLQAYVSRSSSSDCLSFQAGEANTWLHPYLEHGGWAWGTDLDAHNARDNHENLVTIIGPGLAAESSSYSAETSDLGSSEYVLKGRRVDVDPAATSITVIDDLELTCESNEKLCDVTAALLVQRMKSPMSKEVCDTTTVTQSRTLNRDSHHQKLHLKADPVPLGVTCSDGSQPSGRSFIVKSQVTLTSGNDNHDYVIVERGHHDDPALAYRSGFSITNVLQNF